MAVIYFVLGVVAGYLIGKGHILRSVEDELDEKQESLLEKQAEEKKKNMQSILGLLETQGKLTNNHIEMMLGISDATATRYLEELEKEGKVRQVGTTGHAVYYEKI